MNRGGAETMIMNIYRHIDRDKVQFDFIQRNNAIMITRLKIWEDGYSLQAPLSRSPCIWPDVDAGAA